MYRCNTTVASRLSSEVDGERQNKRKWHLEFDKKNSIFTSAKSLSRATKKWTFFLEKNMHIVCRVLLKKQRRNCWRSLGIGSPLFRVAYPK
jgi:hypothetical protein